MTLLISQKSHWWAASSKGGAAFAFSGMPLALLGLALDGDASWS